MLTWDPRYLFDDLIPDEVERHHFLTEVCSPAWNSAQDGGRLWAEAVAEATARHPGAHAHIRAFDEQWHRTVGGVIDGTAAILRELRAAGIGVYGLTNFSAEKWPIAVERWPVLAELDGVVVSGSERVTKPDPRIYRLLLDRFGLAADRTFFTDDAQVNVDGARAVGISAERFLDPASLREQLRRLGLLAQD